MATLEEALRRAEAKLSEKDYAALKAVVEAYAYLTELVDDKNTTIARLRKMLFGEKTEKTAAVSGHPPADGALAAAAEGDGKTNTEGQGDWPTPHPLEGHGRNGANAYTGAQKIEVPHPSLQPGDLCPDCGKGTVYESGRPGVLVRLVGQPPVGAKVYYLQKLRCNLCGKVFTATVPEAVGNEKYDATVASTIALLKYGSGMPFNRLERLQGTVGIPLPASTQWDLVYALAEHAEPAFEELVRQAAQGDVVYNDDSATSKGWRVQWETKPTGAIAKSPVAWMAGRRETE